MSLHSRFHMDGDDGVKQGECKKILEQPEGVQGAAKKWLQISKKY